MNTDRDLHYDQENPPTENNFYLEMQTQCLALFFQTRFDKGDKTFDDVVKYFLEDLLTWYGGRSKQIPPNAVEKYFIPIMAAVSRQVDSAPEISTIIKKYVIDIDSDLSKLSDDEKEKAVIDGFTAFTRSSEIVNKRNKEFMESGQADKPFDFSVHKRGSKEDGLKRLLGYFYQEYKGRTAPVRNLEILIEKHMRELKGIVDQYSENLGNNREQERYESNDEHKDKQVVKDYQDATAGNALNNNGSSF